MELFFMLILSTIGFFMVGWNLEPDQEPKGRTQKISFGIVITLFSLIPGLFWFNGLYNQIVSLPGWQVPVLAIACSWWGGCTLAAGFFCEKRYLCPHPVFTQGAVFLSSFAVVSFLVLLILLPK